MVNTIPTRGEMERSLSQSLQAFYRQQLSCRVGKISCHILDDKVAISVENSITSIEKLLDSSDDRRFLRDRIDSIVKSEVMQKIKQNLGVEAIDLTINTTLENNFTGILAFLREKPSMRYPKRGSS